MRQACHIALLLAAGRGKRTVGPGEHAQVQVLELGGAQVEQVRCKAGRQQLGIQLACSAVRLVRAQNIRLHGHGVSNDGSAHVVLRS